MLKVELAVSWDRSIPLCAYLNHLSLCAVVSWAIRRPAKSRDLRDKPSRQELADRGEGILSFGLDLLYLDPFSGVVSQQLTRGISKGCSEPMSAVGRFSFIDGSRRSVEIWRWLRALRQRQIPTFSTYTSLYHLIVLLSSRYFTWFSQAVGMSLNVFSS